jgi:hypothetical protein
VLPIGGGAPPMSAVLLCAKAKVDVANSMMPEIRNRKSRGYIVPLESFA